MEELGEVAGSLVAALTAAMRHVPQLVLTIPGWVERDEEKVEAMRDLVQVAKEIRGELTMARLARKGVGDGAVGTV